MLSAAGNSACHLVLPLGNRDVFYGVYTAFLLALRDLRCRLRGLTTLLCSGLNILLSRLLLIRRGYRRLGTRKELQRTGIEVDIQRKGQHYTQNSYPQNPVADKDLDSAAGSLSQLIHLRGVPEIRLS